MILKDLHQNKGIQSWKNISSFLNQRQSSTKRTAKQCRQRYNNFLKIKETPQSQNWSLQESYKLFNLFKQKGSKWVSIARQMPKRSQNSLKNKFYGVLRKVMNSINRLCVSGNCKLKPLKYQTLTKILQKKEQQIYGQQAKICQKAQFCQDVREEIIQAMIKLDITQNDANSLFEKTRKFNILTRTENMARNRQTKTNRKKFIPHLIQNIKEQTKCQHLTQFQNQIIKINQKKEGQEAKIKIQGVHKQEQECFYDKMKQEVELGQIGQIQLQMPSFVNMIEHELNQLYSSNQQYLHGRDFGQFHGYTI